MKGYIVRETIRITGNFYQEVPKGTIFFREAGIEIDETRFPPIISLERIRYEKVLNQGVNYLEEIKANTKMVKELAKLRRYRLGRWDNNKPTTEQDSEIEKKLRYLLQEINRTNNNDHK